MNCAWFPYPRLVLASALLVAGMAWHSAVEAASLRLTWIDNSNNEDGFQIERMAPNGSFVRIATVGANVTSYTDSGLTADVSYCYVVRAFNSAGISNSSNRACANATSGTSGGTGGSSGTTGSGSSPRFDTSLTLSNISDSGSTRGSVLTEDNVMIGGFIIEGAAPKTVLIRGRGPSMGGAPFFVPWVLADPFLQLFSGSTVIAQNNNWQDSPICDLGFACGGVAEIMATGLDPCQPNPGQTSDPPGCAQESAILMILLPGAYTAILSGVGGGTGVGLVEVFEVDGATNPSKLVNISTRGLVQTGDNVLIGGIINSGPASKTVLIRARGPSMGGAPFFVPWVLADPFLQLISGSTVIAQNNDWQDSPICDLGFACGGVAEIMATGLDPCQPNPGQTVAPPGCAQESAILINLPPGAYTAILSGVGGGAGVGLVEIFELNY